MDLNDLKLYSAKVGKGSGVLFQPMNKCDYTYILTANHNFKGKRKSAEDPRNEEEYLLTEIAVYIPKHYETEPINIILIENENYFPHNEADIAILRIEYVEGFENIYTNPSYLTLNDSVICGFPTYKDGKDTIEEKYTSYELRRYISEIDFLCKAQLTSETKEQSQIGGLSGGGIMRIENNAISLIGIQSEVSSHVPNGQIEFVPIKYFDDIISYPENEGKLSQMFPPFMGSFEYLKDKAFNINAGIDDDDISFTRTYLKSKAAEVIDSDITPIFIRNFFKERLLLNEIDSSKLNNELIYLTWLEFLSIINIAKEKKHNRENLEDVFNVLRLIYRDTDSQWQDSEFLKECLETDYDRLKEGGTVLIKTNILPPRADVRHYKIDKGSVISRIDYLRSEFENGNLGDIFINNASNELKEFAFDKYNFIHFEYLKEFLLVANCKDYASFKRKNIDELKEKLKIEYGKLFSGQ
jgi:hypothetical protein